MVGVIRRWIERRRAARLRRERERQRVEQLRRLWDANGEIR
jgi:hypothetical protein